MSNSNSRQETRNNRWQQHQREGTQADANRNRYESFRRYPGEHSGQNQNPDPGNQRGNMPQPNFDPSRQNPIDYDAPNRNYSGTGLDSRSNSWQGRQSASQPSPNREWVTGNGQTPYHEDQQQHREAGQGEYPGSRQSNSRPGSGSRFSGQSPSIKPSFAGRGPRSYKRSDDRITEDINEELTKSHDLDASDITVETLNGEAILKGFVTDRAAKRRAEEIAESCFGVQDVQNQIRIRQEVPSGFENDSRSGVSPPGTSGNNQTAQPPG